MEQQTKTNLLNPETWIRLLYMIVFGLLSVLARMVIWVVAVLQFLLVLVTGSGNQNLRDLGQGASKWTYQAFLFLTFNSNDKPFPFSDWPEIDSREIDNREIDSPEVESSEVGQPEETDETNLQDHSPESTNIDDVPTFVKDTEDMEDVEPDQKKSAQ